MTYIVTAPAHDGHTVYFRAPDQFAYKRKQATEMDREQADRIAEVWADRLPVTVRPADETIPEPGEAQRHSPGAYRKLYAERLKGLDVAGIDAELARRELRERELIAELNDTRDFISALIAQRAHLTKEKV